MAENGSQNTITKWRYDFMTASDSKIKLEAGHFLNPIFPSPVNALPNLPPHAFTYTGNNGSVPFHVNFNGWQTPCPAWNRWVQRMEPRHGPTWRSVGIYHAIKSTTTNIILHKEVIMSLARKWFSETNTFIFKWGEASITIEDVYFLGGFPPLGDPVTQNLDTRELLQADQRLKEARRMIQNSTGLKKVHLNHWIWLFQRNANEFADIEHAAFLVFWLSKFVFTKRADVVGKHVHSIAIRLTMGVRIALAPAVLASIYQDLRKLNSEISREGTINLDINAPMHLLQIWAWERFPHLKPPSVIAPNRQIMARWNGCRRTSLELSVIDMLMETSADVFSWRPYVWRFENHELTKNLYEYKELRARVYSELDPQLTALVKFVRPSKLKGFDCIEQYRPHRVARQFGYDQDLPAPVLRNNQNYFAAITDYNRPVEDQILYLPPKLGKSKVTSRYLIWWKRSKPHDFF